jgi:2-methylisocitrate lyase-like PEP mutase family enzyme
MTDKPAPHERRARFRDLHADGLFVMPNAWDLGSARILAGLGFQAIATTSSGHAASLGRADQNVTLDELLVHVAALSEAIEVPLSVDAERGFADDPAGVARTVNALADAGASGSSIEDYDPATGRIDPLATAVDRVAAAAEAAHRHGLVITARAENHLYGIDDFEETMTRLRAYREAGADVLYAPGLTDANRIRRLVDELEMPINVLAMREAPSVAHLVELGVRRVSTGGGLTRAAYGALIAAAREIQRHGTWSYLDAAVSGAALDELLREGRRPTD